MIFLTLKFCTGNQIGLSKDFGFNQSLTWNVDENSRTFTQSIMYCADKIGNTKYPEIQADVIITSIIT